MAGAPPGRGVRGAVPTALVAFIVRFTTNRMCVKNNTHIYVVQTSNNRVILME